MKQQHPGASAAKASDPDKQQREDHCAVVPLAVSPKQACQLLSIGTTRLYELLSGEGIDDIPEIRDAIAGDMPVPATSIYSRTDGIVNWRTSLLRPSDTAENIEVHLASHIGLGVNAAALWAVADRLAQAEGEFHPFDRSGPFAIAYGSPVNAQSGSVS